MGSPITHIETITPSGSVATVSFTSIPQTYDDLLMIGTLKGTSSSLWDPARGDNTLLINSLNSSQSYGYAQIYSQVGTGTVVQYQNQNNEGPWNSSDQIRLWGLAGAKPDYGGYAQNQGGSVYMYMPGYSVTTNSPTRNFLMWHGVISNNTNALSMCVQSHGGINTTSGISNITYSGGTGNFATDAKMSLYGIKNT